MAVRSQADSLGDQVSARTALSFDPAEDKTRQEFARDVDINLQLARFGVPLASQLAYGEVDFTLDRLTALNAVQETAQAIASLPPDVLARYGGPAGVFQAVHEGTFTLDPEPEPESGSKVPPSPAPAP